MPNTPVPAAATGLPTARPVYPNFGTVPFQPNDMDVRKVLGDEIERLIYLLDLLDGDSDFEEGADLEPSLAGGSCFECDAELDTADDEPSLGAAETGAGDQTRWCQGSAEDLEDAAEAGTCHRVRNLLDLETDAARATSTRLGAIIARLSGVTCATAARL